MVAVECMIRYCDLVPEAALATNFDNNLHDWPTKGNIVVKELLVGYCKSLPLSLAGITFNIKGGS
jgi:hypothetical protein